MRTFIGIFITVSLLCGGCKSSQKASGVKSITEIPYIQPTNMETKSIIFLYSFHHGNTRKIANAIASEINATVLNVNEINIENVDFSTLEEYELIGFGSGIDSDKHYQLLLDFAENLPDILNKKAFIFSTCGVYSEERMLKINHKALRNILQNKGFVIVGEFSCPGHNTNSFLKYFGGINKNRPNADDLRNAELFAGELLRKHK
jgi:flavodoxin